MKGMLEYIIKGDYNMSLLESKEKKGLVLISTKQGFLRCTFELKIIPDRPMQKTGTQTSDKCRLICIN